MDSVSAIGLAGNIVQFVDFSWKLFNQAKGLYDSSDGASAEYNELEMVTNDLHKLNTDLTAQSAVDAIPESIRGLAIQCKGVADELLLVLGQVKAKEPNKKWKSFIQALKMEWRKERIDSFIQRLDRLRNEMQFKLQIVLSERTSEIGVILTNLVIENRKLAKDRAEQLGNLLQQVRETVSSLKREAEKERVSRHDQSRKGSPASALVGDDALSQWPELMKVLSSRLMSLAEQVNATATDHILLRSLWFPAIKERQENIASSHRRTFDWVLDVSSPMQFTQWLRNENGIYGIVGKAGSGKSTLMKYICNHRKVEEKLKAWAGSRKLVTASFFFWNAGTSMQKSQEGLFKSLLHEILRQCPNLIRTVCASKAETFQPFVNELEPWTGQELRQALGLLKQHSGVETRFCFFIDGLDEYDGDPDHLIEILESLRRWQDIKLCISSRPWNEFVDILGQPQLALEDLTRPDIIKYVKDTLEENEQFKLLTTKDSRSPRLVREVVDKARGVFLWVVLVVKSLLNGVRNADRISDLQRRLQEFPGTLELYFRHMVNSIEPIYRRQMAETFRFALEARGPLRLITYSMLDEEDPDLTYVSNGGYPEFNDMLLRVSQMKKRLASRTKGLLEVVNDDKTTNAIKDLRSRSQLQKLKVDFLHRTAHDFLLTKDMQNMFGENLRRDFEPKIRLCKALFAHISSIEPKLGFGNERLITNLLEDLGFYASRLEDENGYCPVDVLDAVDGYILQTTAGEFLWARAGSLSLAVKMRLYLYIDYRLNKKPQIQKDIKASLLASALTPSNSSDPKMVDLLLRHGASPEDQMGSYTVWGKYLQDLYRNKSTHVSPNTFQVIHSLICYGADLSYRVLTARKTNRSYKVKDTYSSSAEILRELMGELKAKELIAEAHAMRSQDRGQRSVFSQCVAS